MSLQSESVPDRTKPDKTGQKGILEGANHRYLKAVVALKENSSVAAAAAAIGVSDRTLYRYLEDPDFKELYREILFRDLSQSIGQISASAQKAIFQLEFEIASGERSADRISAAKALLDYAFKGVDLLHTVPKIESLHEEVETLKESLGGNSGATE